jgi:hypothetical protein
MPVSIDSKAPLYPLSVFSKFSVGALSGNSALGMSWGDGVAVAAFLAMID